MQCADIRALVLFGCTECFLSLGQGIEILSLAHMDSLAVEHRAACIYTED